MENMGPEPNRIHWPKAVLVVVVPIVFFVIFLIGFTYLFNEFSSRGSDASAGACQDNLRTIDSMIMQYEADHGKGVYPTTIEEAVPTYLKDMPKERLGGVYSLDTSGEYPVGRCSLHGTLDDFNFKPHIPSSNPPGWLILVLIAVIIFVAIGGMTIALVSTRRKGLESTWGKYPIPATLWLGGILILASTLFPLYKEVLEGAWVWNDATWLGVILLAFSLISIGIGFAQLSGGDKKAIYGFGVFIFLELSAWSVYAIYDALEQMDLPRYWHEVVGIESAGLGLVLLASGAIIALVGCIMALINTRKMKEVESASENSHSQEAA